MKWSTKTPREQGWFWYRASSNYYPVPTFIEDCGGGRFRAVEVYERSMVYIDDLDVEWWPEMIPIPVEDA